MLKQLLNQAITSASPVTTYSTGLLQVKAYKILKNLTNEALIKYELNSLDWAFLGLLYSNPKGFKLAEAAEILGIEASYMTLVIDALEQKKLVVRITDTDDKRYKIVQLTESGKKLVPKVETYLRNKTRYLFKGTNLKNILIYVSVLKHIVENYTANNKN